MLLGIEPETASIPALAIERPWLDIRDASALYRDTGYLHAKALYIDAGGAGDILVSGSANPSGPAWLESVPQRNEEAVIVHFGDSASAAAQDLASLATRLGSTRTEACRGKARELASLGFPIAGPQHAKNKT